MEHGLCVTQLFCQPWHSQSSAALHDTLSVCHSGAPGLVYELHLEMESEDLPAPTDRLNTKSVISTIVLM